MPEEYHHEYDSRNKMCSFEELIAQGSAPESVIPLSGIGINLLTVGDPTTRR